MNTSVRWIYQTCRTHSGLIEAGQKPTLCIEAGDKMLCIGAGHPVRVLVRKLDDTKKTREVRTNNQASPYPITQAAERLWGIGETNGMTSNARRLLRRVLDGDTTELDPNQFEDEEETAVTENTNPVPETDDNDNTNPKTEEKTMSTKTKTKAKAKAKAAPKAKDKAPKAKAAPKAKDKAPREGKRAKAEAMMRKRVEAVSDATTGDAEWRSKLVATTSKESGVSEISCRTILRRLLK